MIEPTALKPDIIDAWADAAQGPVALHLKQTLLPVEIGSRIIYPPTYADIGYNIDSLSDGTKVTMIDSVGSQANRMEPIFKQEPFSNLVPQLEIELHRKEENDGEFIEKVSVLDLAHRSADAVVHASPTLAPMVKKAFLALRRRGDAGPLCRIAPTSLVFGVWDSRGESSEKRPRLVRSIIRAWDVERLHTAAQFNSIWKSLDETQQAELKKEEKKKGKAKRSDVGLADAPAIFRKSTKMAAFVDGIPNPELRVHGGVLVNGVIERDVTVNLIALRRLHGDGDEESRCIRRYLLSLALIAATAEIDLFLREGCHLRFADEDLWSAVPRRGDPIPVDLASVEAHKILLEYARTKAEHFMDAWPEQLIHKFDLTEAKKLLSKSVDSE